MGFKLSHQEKEILRDITDLAMYSVTVINDLYSWPKEIKCHLERPGSELPFNAVAILMRHGGYSEMEAFRTLRQKQKQLEGRHLSLLHELKARMQHEGSGLSMNQDLFLQTMQAAASGSELWSIYTKRYPSKEDLGQPEVEFVDNEFKYKNERSNEVDATTVEIEEQLPALKIDVISMEPEQRPITPPLTDPDYRGSVSSQGSLKACVSQEEMPARKGKVNIHTAYAEQASLSIVLVYAPHLRENVNLTPWSIGRSCTIQLPCYAPF